MINRVVLVGRLTRDPDKRATKSGMEVSGFTIAFDTYSNSQDGNNRTSNFINCSAFGKTAGVINRYCRKGSQIAIEGRLQQRKYNRNDGTSASTIDIIVDNVELLGSKSNSSSNGNSQSGNDGGFKPASNNANSNNTSEDTLSSFGDDSSDFVYNDEDSPF